MFFRTNFGPVKMAFERLDEGARGAQADAKAVLERFNPASERALAPAESARVVARRA